MNRTSLSRQWSARPLAQKVCACGGAFILVPALLVLSGCVTVDPEPDYERAREAVAAAVGGGSYPPTKEERVDEQVRKLLEDGPSAQESVLIALLNNHHLQALFLEIGVGRADAVQAGLLSNPSLGRLLRTEVVEKLARIDETRRVTPQVYWSIDFGPVKKAEIKLFERLPVKDFRWAEGSLERSDRGYVQLASAEAMKTPAVVVTGEDLSRTGH